MDETLEPSEYNVMYLDEHGCFRYSERTNDGAQALAFAKAAFAARAKNVVISLCKYPTVKDCKYPQKERR